MLKGIDILEDIFGDSPRFLQKIAEAQARGFAIGLARAKAKQSLEVIRKMTLQLLERKFGLLPEALTQRISTADAEWCQNLFDRAISAETIEELTAEA